MANDASKRKAREMKDKMVKTEDLYIYIYIFFFF